MAIDISKWFEVSQQQQDATMRTLSNAQAVQLVSNAVNRSGRTPGVRLNCDPRHSIGWMIHLTIEDGSISYAFTRENKSVNPNGLRITHLAALPQSGSIRASCNSCGREHLADLSRLVQKAIVALATPKRTNAHKAISLT